MNITHEIEMLIGIAVLACTAIVVARLSRGDEIKIERARPDASIEGKSYKLGECLAVNICPLCCESDFYNGPGSRDAIEIYCGNPECRTAFEVTNLGPGNVWAKVIGKAHDRFYDKPVRASNNNKWQLSRVWTRRHS